VRSADEQKVLELEYTLWKYVADLDLGKYAGLWEPNAVAWRDGGYCLSGQKEAINWLQRYQAGGLSLEEYSVGPMDVRATGNTAVAYYNVSALWLDNLGRGTPKQSRVTHTWVKAHGRWRIFAESVF
jgi:ketosteroid isomerase-like protein